MENSICCRFYCPISSCNTSIARFSHGVVFAARGQDKKSRNSETKLPKNLRYPRRTKPPPDFHPVLHRVEESIQPEPPSSDVFSDSFDYGQDENYVSGCGDGDIIWTPDEIEAISSLFQGRVPQKPGNLNRERPLPLPIPHKIRPLGFPTHKNLTRTQLVSSARQPITNRVYKNPSFLIGLAKEIRSLPPEDNVSGVLDQWAPFLRKGSLSLTVRELGHMGVPGRALNVFCWAQSQPHLFPDDRILAATVEVLARARDLKMPFDLDKFVSLASRGVLEAMVKGFIKGGNLGLAWKILTVARDSKRLLDAGVYAKLIRELAKNPDKRMLVLQLLEELAKREDLALTQVDCTAMMKVCVKIGKFEMAEALFDWFKRSGRTPTIVMFTTLLHSRYMENRHKEAMAVVWEMEASNCPLDLPAYRVMIKLFVALNDLSRTGRYFSKLKESGFSPTFDIYRDVIRLYMASGRLAKCREICLEVEMAGFVLDEEIRLGLVQLENC